MSLAIILMLVVGMVLIYSAIKGKDPRSVIKEALGVK